MTTLTYLTIDHLGTPILTTDPAGAAVWSGGFEPFGADYAGASDAGIFLRLPGQWIDGTWDGEATIEPLYYNVHRWHQHRIAKYTRPDPINDRSIQNQYAYVDQRPLNYLDPLGLCKCTDECPGGEWSFAGWGWSIALGGGLSGTSGFYQCDSRPDLKVPVRASCGLLGPIAAADVGVQVNFPGGLFPAACGCTRNNLYGIKTAISGTIDIFSFDVSGCGSGPFSIGPRTLLTGVFKSTGAGLAYVRCMVRPWSHWWDAIPWPTTDF